jgi:hypothetical protein
VFRNLAGEYPEELGNSSIMIEDQVSLKQLLQGVKGRLVCIYPADASDARPDIPFIIVVRAALAKTAPI